MSPYNVRFSSPRVAPDLHQGSALEPAQPSLDSSGMCGRFGLGKPDEVPIRFAAERMGEIDAQLTLPRYNIAPTQDILTVAVSKEGRRVVRAMRWGLIPNWQKPGQRGPLGINLRSEGLQDRGGYKTILARRRCIIPADGFYEWRKLGKAREPWSIGLKDGGLYGFAGIWDARKDGDIWTISCSILTTAPNELVEKIHDRMPVILRPEDEDLWLDKTIEEPEILTGCLKTFPAEQMAAHVVPPLVNSVANDGPELRSEGTPATAEQLSLLAE